MLDWTENPLVAAYFAVENLNDDDGCIWALWPTGLHLAFGHQAGIVTIRDPIVRKSAKSVFTGIKPSQEVEVVAIDGQETDPRMVAQMSRFTIHSPTSQSLEQVQDHTNWLRRFVIPKSAKARIRAQLSAFGIRRSNLFPDLASLATELKSGIW